MALPVETDRETIAVTVIEVNRAPVAHAGGDATVIVGQGVTLDGSGSFDLDVPVQTLTYSWSLSSVPAGSALTGLNDAARVAPSFTPDVAGDFVIELIVNDGLVDSSAATVTITAETNTLPLVDPVGDRVWSRWRVVVPGHGVGRRCAGNSLVFSLEGVPAGAAIDPVTRVFSWAPTEAQGPGSYTFDLVVTTMGPSEDRETITVTVNRGQCGPGVGCGR